MDGYIRQLYPRDASLFIDFRKKAGYESEYVTQLDAGNVAFILNEFSTSSSKIAYAYFVRDEKGKDAAITGQLFMSMKSGRVLFINLISVLQETQRQGVATALIDTAKKTAAALKAKEIELIVNKKNSAAIALYEKTGFKLKKNYGSDKLVYAQSRGLSVDAKKLISQW